MTGRACALTIVTINLNNADGLRRTVESVAGQTARSEFEYIVVDGRSTDGSVALLDEYADRIDRSVSEPDTGRYAAMNKGVRLAQGEYLLFLNSGDTLLSGDVIEKILPALDGGTDIVSADTVTDTCRLQAAARLSPMMLTVTSLPHPSAFIRRRLLVKHPYDESMTVAADWRFFFERAMAADISYKRVDMALSRFAPGGISTTNPQIGADERRRVIADYIPLRLYDQVVGEYGFEEITFCSRFGQNSVPRKLTRLFMRVMYKLFGEP